MIFDKRSLPVALEPTKAPAEPAWRISGKDLGPLAAMRLGGSFYHLAPLLILSIVESRPGLAGVSAT